jgi:hypothetical protein
MKIRKFQLLNLVAQALPYFVHTLLGKPSNRHWYYAKNFNSQTKIKNVLLLVKTKKTHVSSSVFSSHRFT